MSEVSSRVPTLTVEAHLLNLCTLAAGMVISPENPMGSLGEDVIIAYRKICDAYMAEPDLPH